MLFLAYEMPFLSMKCIDSVTFWNEQKLAHSLKMFQLKFAAARTITVEVSKLQCQMLQFFEIFLIKKGSFFKTKKNKIFFDDFV